MHITFNDNPGLMRMCQSEMVVLKVCWQRRHFIPLNDARLLAKCECERLRSSIQVSALVRNMECQKARRYILTSGLFVCLFVSSYSQGVEYWIKSDP